MYQLQGIYMPIDIYIILFSHQTCDEQVYDWCIFIFKAPILEYCGSDTFSPTCQETEILLIHHAHYGRMKLGRCVTVDLGYIGCSSNVLAWMDRQCSGKQTCEIRVPNHELNQRLECLPPDITPYLEVSSSCSPGNTDQIFVLNFAFYELMAVEIVLSHRKNLKNHNMTNRKTVTTE